MSTDDAIAYHSPVPRRCGRGVAGCGWRRHGDVLDPVRNGRSRHLNTSSDPRRLTPTRSLADLHLAVGEVRFSVQRSGMRMVRMGIRGAGI